MRFAIERAHPEMAREVTSIAREAKASWGYPQGWLDAWRPALTIGAEYIASHRVFVATAGGVSCEKGVLGFVALEKHADNWALAHVWVRPVAQGRGVGRQLVERALAEARAVAPELVIRVESDPNAAEFYIRLGAHGIGSVPAPVAGDGERALPLLEFAPVA